MPTTPPTPAATNEMVEMVAIEFAQTMSSCTDGPHTWSTHDGESRRLFVLEIDSAPLIDPAMTPAPAICEPAVDHDAGAKGPFRLLRRRLDRTRHGPFR
jgi:hypothetical protein